MDELEQRLERHLEAPWPSPALSRRVREQTVDCASWWPEILDFVAAASFVAAFMVLATPFLK